MPADERDEMLREMARHRGFRLVKSRKRKPGVGDFGRYGLADARSGKECFGFGRRGLEATADQIEQFLRGKAQAEWKSSLAAPVERPAPRLRRQAPREQPEKARPAPVARSRSRRPAKPAVREALARPAPRQPAPAPKQASLEIREATPRDADSIVRLLGDMGEQAESSRLRKTIKAFSERGNPLLVADQDGVLGCAAWEVLLMPQHAAPVGRITLLVTAKSDRRRGIGTALLQAVEERLKRNKCHLIELVHDIELSSANSFLRERGYKRSGYRFARELSGDVDA